MTASSISQVSNCLGLLSLCTPRLCWRRLGHDGCCWEGWALKWEQSLCGFPVVGAAPASVPWCENSYLVFP